MLCLIHLKNWMRTHMIDEYRVIAPLLCSPSQKRNANGISHRFGICLRIQNNGTSAAAERATSVNFLCFFFLVSIDWGTQEKGDPNLAVISECIQIRRILQSSRKKCISFVFVANVNMLAIPTDNYNLFFFSSPNSMRPKSCLVILRTDKKVTAATVNYQIICIRTFVSRINFYL